VKLRCAFDGRIRAPNGFENGRIRARDENILPANFMTQHGLNNFGDLPGRFPFAKNDFGVSLAQGAMMIHFGEAQILKGEVLQPGNGAVGRQGSEADEIQQLVKFALFHESDSASRLQGRRSLINFRKR